MTIVERSANLHWVAEYEGGTVLTEKDVSYGNLKREGLVSFGLCTTDEKPLVVIPLDEGKVLFYRMRVEHGLHQQSSRTYLTGYRERATGKTHLVVVSPDGKTETLTGFTEKIAPLEWFPQEQV